MDVFSEIRKLPNLGYTYSSVNGRGKLVVLGSTSCQVSDDYRFASTIIDTNNKIYALYYQKASLSEEDNEHLDLLMEKMIHICDSRMPGTYSSAEQRDYLNQLSPSELSEIEEQVVMYKACYSHFKAHAKKK